MNHPSRLFSLLVLTLLSLIGNNASLYAQEPETPEASAAPVPITLQKIEIKSQAPSGSSALWTKIIVQYETSSRWLDGVTLLYEVLLKPEGEGKQKPVIAQGSIGFANIPQGKNSAIIYLTPGATLRYGKPAEIRVTVMSGDNTVGNLAWPDKKAADPQAKKEEDNWVTQYNRRDGLLLPLRFTPFLLTDYDLMPDPLAQ